MNEMIEAGWEKLSWVSWGRSCPHLERPLEVLEDAHDDVVLLNVGLGLLQRLLRVGPVRN